MEVLVGNVKFGVRDVKFEGSRNVRYAARNVIIDVTNLENRNPFKSYVDVWFGGKFHETILV